MEIIKAKVILDRSWIGNAESLNPFGKDLVKSFIEVTTPVEEIPSTAALVDALFQLKGLDDEIITLNYRKRNIDDYPNSVMDFIDVYRNLLSSCEYTLQDSKFIIKNYNEGDKAYVLVQWTSECTE
ncbi:MAG: hypothetical protein ACOCT9_02930 [archaeon]